MKNLILSAACGLDSKSIEFFLKSLRKYYKGEICFIINKGDLKIKKFLKIYNCHFVETKTHKFDVQVKRYELYLKFILEKNYNKILVCDSRDIYFQSDPFLFEYKGDINFFLEGKKIKECPFNTNWIKKTYGQKIYESLSDKIINCSGTTIGTYNSMKKYFELIIQHSRKYKYKKKLKYLLTFRRDKGGRGADQAYANYIVHNKLINNSYLYPNDYGPIATVFYLNKISFNQENKLINLSNIPYSIVHQYDKRWDEFKDSVTKIKKNLDID